MKTEQPVYVRYHRLLKMLSEMKDTKSGAKHWESLFGGLTEFSYPAVFSEFSVAKDWGISWERWKKIPVRDRAKMIAHSRIQDMVETLTRHDNTVRSNLARKSGNG